MKIAVIIPTPTSERNTQLLSKALSSLCKYKSPDYEYQIIVVANDWEGYSIPVNKGLRLVNKDVSHVLLMNDDVEILGLSRLWHNRSLSKQTAWQV
jgi:hypothetical protein